MTVTAEDIHKIAHLGRVQIEETKIPEYTQHLNNLLKLVEQMAHVDTQHIEPMSHPLEGQHQRFRDDNITEVNQREKFQKIAPSTAEGLYIVPKVIE